MGLIRKILKMKDSVMSIMALLFITKILGFIKFRIIAGTFGASRELDIFWAAFLIPDTLFNILIAGSINAAVIPVFSDILTKKGGKLLVKLMQATILGVSLVSILLSLIIFIFAKDISQFVITNGLIGESLGVSSSLSVSDLDLLTVLMRITLLSPILLGISSIITAYLQVHKRFFVTTLAPLIYNLGMILGTLLLSKYVGLGVKGLAWSAVIGSVLHLLIQVPLVAKFVSINRENNGEKMPDVPKGFYLKEVLRIVKLSIPRIAAFISEQFNVVINTIISFSLTAGALSAYKFALSLYQFPVHIVAGAFAQISLPDLSEAYSKGDIKSFRSIYNKALRKVLFVIFPSVAIIIVLRLPIVRLAFGTGEFDWWDTVVTSWALALLGFAIIGQSVVSLTLRALYSVHETRLPLVATFITIIVNVIASYYFTNFFSHYLDWRPIVSQVLSQLSAGISSDGTNLGITVTSLWGDLGKWFTTRNVYDASIGGLSLGLSIAFTVEMILNMIFLNMKVKIFDKETMIRPIFKMFLSTIIMFAVMYISFKFIDFTLDTTRTIYVLTVFISTSGIGLVVYTLMSYLFNVPEVNIIDQAVDKIKGFIRAGKK